MRVLEFDIVSFRFEPPTVEVAITDGLEEWTAHIDVDDIAKLKKWLESIPIDPEDSHSYDDLF